MSENLETLQDLDSLIIHETTSMSSSLEDLRKNFNDGFEKYLDKKSYGVTMMSSYGAETTTLRTSKNLSLAQEFESLGKNIMSLDETLGNPLYLVSQDLQAFCRMIFDQDNDSYFSPENIITMALKNGPRDNSNLQQVSKDHPVAKVNPKPRSKAFLSFLIDILIKYVVKVYHPNGIEKYSTLENNFGPVRDETAPIGDLKVEGRIPETLNGMMVRNGPNPVFTPAAHYYWLDGDSMIHAIHFDKGNATYISRYVKTSRFTQEQFHGKGQFLQYGDLHGEFGLFMASMQLLKEKLGILDMSHGWSNANVGVIYHNERLMILQDWDKPYVVDVQENGDLITLGIINYNKRLGHNVTPHPKKDPVTGELFVIGTSNTSPYATLSIISKEGDISAPVTITTSGPTYMHDFGLTENYIIIMDLPFYYDPKKMLEQGTWIYSFSKKNSCFGILPRSAKIEEGIKWFKFDRTFFIFHNGNAWEEDEDTLVLISVVLEPKVTKVSEVKKIDNPANRVDNLFSTLAHDEAENNICEISFKPPLLFSGRNTDEIFTESKLFKLTFNMKTGEVHAFPLSETHFEYPKINESYIGRKSKYVYLSELNKDVKIPSIVKYDLERNSETKLNFGEEKYGSEVAFVSLQSLTLLEEDDGFLTTFVHDDKNSISFAYVICAKEMKVLAKIELPSRVPFGFHATFVTKEELLEAKNRTNIK